MLELNITGKQKLTVGCDDTESNERQVIRSHVLNQLTVNIEEYCDSGESLPMADITTSYNNRIAALGFSSIRWNTIPFRETYSNTSKSWLVTCI